MKTIAFSTAILCAAGLVAAAPGTAMRRERAAERFGRRSNPLRRVEGDLASSAANNSNVEYSDNWAGAVLVGSGYTTVTGTIKVPTPSVPSTSSKKQASGSAWVGIDGDTCQTAILQTGVDFTVQRGSVTYDAWYEWYPDYSYDFSNFEVSAGDTIKMYVESTVTASSKTGGTAVLENVTTGKSATHTFTGESAALCETNAEWIVEDYESGSSLVPFADFGTVTFTDASVNGGTGVSGASIFDIEQGSSVLTSCATSGSSSVTCSYVS
ncbi:peptidase A4 family-domain-containing protein [Xylariaceae sp. FL0804]|nr:peptidase A4 family-domain-containing protein [Xylariaceae sp. FL0804]